MKIMGNNLNRSVTGQSVETPCGEVVDTRPMPVWKRLLDVGVIVVFSPVLLLLSVGIVILVKCGSRGPVLFRQRRVGYRGSEFICYKFRSMKVDADTNPHRGYTTQMMKSGTPMTKLDAERDPRIIPFGWLIRSTGLDELPQLINVLRGEMSLVGPRPCIPYEYEMYEPWQRRRFDAVPGLTGLWQVSGKNRTTFNQMIHLDIEYSERSNLWLDLKIMLKTLPALVVQCYDTHMANPKHSAVISKPSSVSVEENVRPLHV